MLVGMEFSMEGEEMEAAMERAWDLHDKMSDAIHSLSKSHFLSSISTLSNEDHFFAEITSLNAIRNALETLENHLHLLHASSLSLDLFEQTLQLQQRVEKDAALMHLEESRLMLLKRLKEHRGRDLSVIKEALAFASDGGEAEDARFNSNVIQDCSMAETNKMLSIDKNEKKSNDTRHLQNRCQGGLAYFLDFGVQFVKNSENLNAMTGVVAKVALVAASMLAIFRLQQTSPRTTKEDNRRKASRIQKNTKQYTGHQSETNAEDCFPKKLVGESTQLPQHYRSTSLDVLFGRG